MVRLYARALKGKRARGNRPQKRGKNVSMVSAITIKGVLSFFNVWGATDGITFEAFLVRKLIPKLWKGACVVLDNCNIYKGKEIEKAIEKVGGQLLYLSPYSPDFSQAWKLLVEDKRDITDDRGKDLSSVGWSDSKSLSTSVLSRPLPLVYSLLLLYFIYLRNAILSIQTAMHPPIITNTMEMNLAGRSPSKTGKVFVPTCKSP